MTYDQQQAGMEITIAVRCQCCDESQLNTLGRTREKAKANAESMGWVFVPGSGWECPTCWADRD